MQSFEPLVIDMDEGIKIIHHETVMIGRLRPPGDDTRRWEQP
jgi:hypothetical protein